MIERLVYEGRKTVEFIERPRMLGSLGIGYIAGRLDLLALMVPLVAVVVLISDTNQGTLFTYFSPRRPTC